MRGGAKHLGGDKRMSLLIEDYKLLGKCNKI